MKNSKPILSIIIPIYNVQDYLPQLVNCLSKQIFTNFETVFVDDGSTDMSYDVLIEQVKLLKNKVTIIQQDNAGLSGARNSGILNSVGEYIFFLDSDDEITYDFVQKIIRIIQINNRPDTILFDYMCIDELGKSIESTYGHGSIYKMDNLTNSSTVLNALSKDEIPTTAWSFVTKKSIIVNNKIYFSVGKKFEDTNFTPKVIYYSNKIKLISEKMYKYRQRTGSIMDTHTDKDAFDAIFVVEDLYKFAKNNSSSSLNAVVGRAAFTTLSSFLNMNDVYKKISPILISVKPDFIKQNSSVNKLVKLCVFRYLVGYKLYSGIKRML